MWPSVRPLDGETNENLMVIYFIFLILYSPSHSLSFNLPTVWLIEDQVGRWRFIRSFQRFLPDKSSMISCGWKASPSLIWSSISHQPIFPDLRSVVHQSDILVREKVNQERWQPKVGLVLVMGSPDRRLLQSKIGSPLPKSFDRRSYLQPIINQIERSSDYWWR